MEDQIQPILGVMVLVGIIDSIIFLFLAMGGDMPITWGNLFSFWIVSAPWIIWPAVFFFIALTDNPPDNYSDEYYDRLVDEDPENSY